MASDLFKDRSQLFIYNHTKNCPKKSYKKLQPKPVEYLLQGIIEIAR